MNYLAHLHLGGDRPEQLLGSLYGDFVKGGLTGVYPPAIEASIRLHREIDVFTDAHPIVSQAVGRFQHTQRRFAGIVVDVFFDHCLARDWSTYSPQSLVGFNSMVYRVLLAEPQLPERLAWIAPRMAAQDWLGSYENFEILDQVLKGISRRLSRPQALAGAMDDLRNLYQPLSADFQAFYPQLIEFATQRRSVF